MRFLIAMVLSAFCANAYSAPSRIEKIESLMRAQGLVEMFDQQLQLGREACKKQADDMLSQMFASLKVTPEYDAKLREAAHAFVEEAGLNWTARDIVDAWAQYYAPNFTDAELDQLLAFYESPLAQKEVAVSRAAMAQLSAEFQKRSEPIVQAATQNFIDRVQQIAKDCNCNKK